MSDALRLYFHVRSPYSRLGLNKLAAAGLTDIIPTRLVIFTGPPDGAPFFDPVTSPPKLGYYMEDVPRMSRRLGLPVQMPNPFEVSYSRFGKAFVAAEAADRGFAFALAVSNARWGQGLNISEMDVLADCAEEAGLSRDLPKEAKATVDLAAYHEEAAKLGAQDGVFGIPFAVLEKDGKRERFWGQDRFDLLIEALAG